MKYNFKVLNKLFPFAILLISAGPCVLAQGPLTAGSTAAGSVIGQRSSNAADVTASDGARGNRNAVSPQELGKGGQRPPKADSVTAADGARGQRQASVTAEDEIQGEDQIPLAGLELSSSPLALGPEIDAKYDMGIAFHVPAGI